MFSRYYQSELSYLRDLGREFARRNPSLSSLFEMGGGDPDVERLLEGFAFLTARIRERADDAVPEVVEALADLLVPQYLRPTPAASIVELTPHPSAVRGRTTLPAGTEMGAKTQSGTVCSFRTTSAVDLLPLRTNGLTLDDSRPDTPELRLALRTSEEGRFAVFSERGIRLHLHGPLPMASMLQLWMERHLAKVLVRDKKGRETPLPDGSIVPAMQSDADALMPWHERSPSGMRLLVEYFTMPAKLLFVDVKNLERVAADQMTPELELVFRFERAPKLPERPDRDAIRLHCVPVINLFDTTAEPIARDRRVHEHLLRAAGLPPDHAEVYEVHKVIGVRREAERVQYPRFFDFEHPRKPRLDQAFYSLRRAFSPIDSGLDTYLSLRTPRGVPPSDIEETLSIELTCTNRGLPTELRIGDISTPTPRSPTLARFTNIARVTRPARPPLGSELHWRLVSHLALARKSLGDTRALKAQLDLYDFHRDADAQVSRANSLRVGAIRDVEARTTTRMVDRAPLRGVETTIDIDESQLAGLGDAHLFGKTIAAMFGRALPMCSFHALTMRMHPSGTEIRWRPTTGEAPLL